MRKLIAIVLVLLALDGTSQAGILCFGGPCANGGGGGGGTPCTNASFDHTVACNALIYVTVGS